MGAKWGTVFAYSTEENVGAPRGELGIDGIVCTLHEYTLKCSA